MSWCPLDIVYWSQKCSFQFNWHTKFPNLPTRFSLKYYFNSSIQRVPPIFHEEALVARLPPLQGFIYVWNCATVHSCRFPPDDLGVWINKMRCGKPYFDSKDKLNSLMNAWDIQKPFWSDRFSLVSVIHKGGLWGAEEKSWGYWDLSEKT